MQFSVIHFSQRNTGENPFIHYESWPLKVELRKKVAQTLRFVGKATIYYLPGCHLPARHKICSMKLKNEKFNHLKAYC